MWKLDIQRAKSLLKSGKSNFHPAYRKTELLHCGELKPLIWALGIATFRMYYRKLF